MLRIASIIARPAICDARRTIAISRGLLMLRISSRIGFRLRISARAWRARRSSTNRFWRETAPSQKSLTRAVSAGDELATALPEVLGRAELGVDRRWRGAAATAPSGAAGPGRAAVASGQPAVAIASTDATSSAPDTRLTSSTSSADSTRPSAASSRWLRGGR